MSSGRATHTERRARRLLRWYPPGWRKDYGDEFGALLAADIADRPRSAKRTVDVARSGLLARLTAAGVLGHDLGSDEHARGSLSLVGATVLVFLVVAGAMWSQLTIGWQWSSPAAGSTAAAMYVMSGAVIVLVAEAALAAAPMAWSVLVALAARRSASLAAPAWTAVVSAVVLVVGSRHFANAWPGTGGHPWAHQGLVPGGVAAFTWAATLSITSYWVHPGALLSFPAIELAWMVVSPLALVGLVGGTARAIRRVPLTPRLCRYEAAMARVAVLAMAVFVAGASSWVIEGGPGPKNLFHTGIIDVAGVVAMTVAALIVHLAMRRTRTRSPLRAG